jgi:glycosyltransferase involved in cell wall biosynthesis
METCCVQILLPVYWSGSRSAALKEREATRDEWLDGVKVHRLRPGTSYVNLGEVKRCVVPPRDSKTLSHKIDVLMHDKEVHKKMGQQAKRRAETQFDRSIVTEMTVRLYKEVLAGCGMVN